MNFKYVLPFHSNEMTQLILFLRLFGKQNQNILVVNYYKMKTAFVWVGAHSIRSWIVMCFGKMTQHGMHPNSFSPEPLWGKICFQRLGEASQLLALLSWMSAGDSGPLKTAQPLFWLGRGQRQPGELPAWRRGSAGWVRPGTGGMWDRRSAFLLGLRHTSFQDHGPAWAGNVPTDPYRN